MKPGLPVLLAALLVVMVVPGCKNPSKEPPPPGVIPKEQFTRLMLDMHLADGWFAYRRAQGEDPKSLAQRIYDSVFTIHGITRKQFEESMEWYAAHPLVLDKIYDEMIHRANVLQISLDSATKQSHPAETIEKR